MACLNPQFGYCQTLGKVLFVVAAAFRANSGMSAVSLKRKP